LVNEIIDKRHTIILVNSYFDSWTCKNCKNLHVLCWSIWSIKLLTRPT